MIKIPENHDENYLFLILMHEISKEFSNHAILKGGMVLKLLGSHRKTIDLDYTFIPFKSKNDVIDDLKKLFSNIDGASSFYSINSKAIRIIVKTKKATVQVEVNVSVKCKSIPMSTGSLSKTLGLAPSIIRVMSFDVSLANKLAAWFERRLIRDLYDIHFLFSVAGALVDMPTLNKRLGHIESKIPKLKKIKKISLDEFLLDLAFAVEDLGQKNIEDELSGFIDEEEIMGLDILIRISIIKLINLIK